MTTTVSQEKLPVERLARARERLAFVHADLFSGRRLDRAPATLRHIADEVEASCWGLWCSPTLGAVRRERKARS